MKTSHGFVKLKNIKYNTKMDKTKFVTSYYMEITKLTNNRWIGSYDSRKQRYLTSIIYHCKNFPSYDVVCYTHEVSLLEIQNIKDEHQLDNLTIKVKELDDIKYTERINLIVDEFPDYMEKFRLSGRPPQVMWGKFDLVRIECTEDIENIYWIDAGLQSVVLFPIRYNQNRFEDDFLTNHVKLANFGLLFNENLINKLNNLINGRFFNIMCSTVQSTVHTFDDYKPIEDYYPIGGFFGGNVKTVLDYCNGFDNAANKHFDNKILCFEDSVMKQVVDLFPKEKLFTLNCDTHSCGLTEPQFHYDEWDETKKLPKPIWRIWEEIRDIK